MENKMPSTPPSPEVKATKDALIKPSYYTTTKRKVSDFCIGFFGGIMLNVLLVFLSFSLSRSGSFDWIGSLFDLLFFVFLIVYFFKKGRRFIAIGMISMILLPLLAFGSCLVLIMGTGNKF
jgi:hypothetical protein